MGCGKSSIGVSDMKNDKSPRINEINSDGKSDGQGVRSLTPCPQLSANHPMRSKRSNLQPLTESALRRPVVFDIPMDDNGEAVNISMRKSLPFRLQRLEPVSGASILTAEMLSDKMRVAEEKRKKQLEKRANKKKNKILKKQKLIQIKQDGIMEEMKEKDRIFEEKKNQKIIEIESKQRRLQEKHEKVRGRAKSLRSSEKDGMEFQMEKDQEFNANNDDESWPDDKADNSLNNKDTTSYKSDSGTGSRIIQVEPVNTMAEEKIKDSEDDGFFD